LLTFELVDVAGGGANVSYVWYKMDWFTRGDWAILSADVS
jgi:hypothetical protein